MASLTGQQIQNTYGGLLKSEDNGVVGINRTKITDGEGNNTGMFFWKQYGLKGIDNSDDTSQSPQWVIGNDNFDVNNSPMGSFGSTVLSFGDFDTFKTFEINQNRFGSVTYNTVKEGQSHIFTGTNGNSPIRINSFNSTNNSDNWYSGYQNSVSDFTISGQDITLTRADNTPFTITVPSGGGGGSQEVRSASSVRPIGQNGFGNIETTYKMTHQTTGYGTQNYLVTSGTEFMVVPFTEVEGYTIDDIAFGVGTGQAGATTNVHLYKAVAKTVNLFGGGTQEVLDGTFVADLATNVDCSTSGMKVINGIGQVLPAAADNLYFFLYRMANGSGVNMTGYSNSQVINPNNSVYLAGTTTYRFVTWQSGGNSSAPTDLDLQSMSASTGDGLIRTLYSTKA